MAADIESQGIALFALALGRGKIRRIGLRIEGVDLLFDSKITGAEFFLIDVVQLNGLRQREQMFVPVVTFEGFGDGLYAAFASMMAELGELLRITLPGNNGADDPHAGHSSDVTDHIVQQQIHLAQSLLHVLDVRGGIPNQVVPLTQMRPQGADLCVSNY